MPNYPSLPTSTDRDLNCWQLVAAVQAGDQSAFGQLYAHYRPMVAKLIYSRTRDRLLTEDLTSETFLRTLRRIHTIHDQGKDLGAWLTTVARSLIADHYKCSRSRLDHTTAEIPEQPTYNNEPEQAALRNDLAATLWALVEQLSPDQRTVVQLRFRDGLSVTDAAASAGCSNEALKARTHRALTSLRQTTIHQFIN
jgi:RNA polymerase sigma factor (sigma-70 family)